MEIWSFFSGGMGLDLGLEEAGLYATLAVEIDKWCCKTIQQNRPNLDFIQGDVSQLSGASLREHRNYHGEVFMTVGGPPCQSFSSGGKRAALSDPRGNLIYEYLRLISEIHPRYFILENVANIVTAALRHRKIKDRPGQRWSLKTYHTNNGDSGDGRPALDPDELSGSAIKQILSDVGQLGYSVVFGILDAADYGAAQHRLRFVMIGSSTGSVPELPKPIYGASRPLLPFRTVRDAIFDLRNDPGPHSSYTPDMARYFEFIPEGGNWRALPKELQKQALGGAFESGGGKTGFFRRLKWDEPSPTITGRANRKASALCHPDQTRPLSVKECARIQGFPDEWLFSGATNQQYQQIGNAVPVDLGKAIGSSIHKAETDDPKDIAELPHEMMLERAITRLRASARNKRPRKAVIQLQLPEPK